MGDDVLDPETYANDDVRVGVGPKGARGEEGWIWIPERLYERMILLARAYGRHILDTTDLEDRELDRDQSRVLAEEVEFLLRVVNDPALAPHLEALYAQALTCARSPSRASRLVISPP